MKLIRSSAGLLLSVILLVQLVALPARGAVLSEASLLQSIQAHLTGQNLPAVSVAVLQSGGALSAHAGSMDLTRATPPDNRTVYEIGSISKPLAGAWTPDRIVIVEFPSDQARDEFASSPEYRQIAHLRERGAVTRAVSVRDR